MGDSWIVDGYQEIRVKVVKKWYFIPVTKKNITREDDGWFRYDYKTNNRNKNYAIVDIKPSY